MEEYIYLGKDVARTHKALNKLITAIVGEYGLTVLQFGVLKTLTVRDGLPARDIVKQLYKDSSTIMAAIDKLETKNLITRRPSNEDRRVTNIFLTAKAKNMMPELLLKVEDLDRELHRVITPEEAVALRSALNKLYTHAVRTSGDRKNDRDPK